MLRKALAALGAGLGVFHVWLFASQAWTGELFARPGSAGRWLLGAGLVAALIGLRRRGVSIVFGRKALAIWLVAGLLHGPAVSGAVQSIDTRALPESTEVFVQLVLAAAAGLGLFLVLRSARSRRPALRFTAATVPGTSPIAARAAVLRRLLAPRPPPFQRAPRFSL